MAMPLRITNERTCRSGSKSLSSLSKSPSPHQTLHRTAAPHVSGAFGRLGGAAVGELSVRSMQHALKTPKKTEVHKSLDFVITEDSLRRLMTKVPAADQLRINFARFIGSTFAGMPRADSTYYLVFAVLHLPTGRSYRTFDQYQMEAGVSVLIYPVHRERRALVRKVLADRVIPACSEWLESLPPRKASSFYAFYDQTFDEIVFGPNEIAEANAGSCLRFAGKPRVVLSLRPGVAQKP